MGPTSGAPGFESHSGFLAFCLGNSIDQLAIKVIINLIPVSIPLYLYFNLYIPTRFATRQNIMFLLCEFPYPWMSNPGDRI